MTTPTTRDGTWDPTIDKRTGKPKRVSKRLQKAIAAIESGACRSIKAASERVGMNYEHLVTMLKKPHVQAFVTQKKRQNLAAAALRGSQRALELVDSPSERTSIEATKMVLAIDGYHADTAPRVSVAVDVRAGYILDLSGKFDRDEPKAIEGVVVVTDDSHRLSGPAAEAIDRVPEPTSYQPDSRWAQTVTTPAPAEPEPVIEDAFERAHQRRQQQESDRVRRRR
jgi:hypothetical protein